jgi:hypothetical protein
MAESYQQKHRCGDEAKDSWCHSPPLSIDMREHSGEVFMDGELLSRAILCSALARSDHLDLGYNLCSIYCARHSTLDRMRDDLKNGFRYC